MCEFIDRLLDLSDRLGITDEVLDIILKTNNNNELIILKSGLEKMLDK